MSIRRKVHVPIKDTKYTEFVTFTYPDYIKEDIAILFKGWDKVTDPIVRIHSECLTGDVFNSQRCDCHAQLHEAIDMFTESGGILLYLRQEGRNIGLYNKLDAYQLQDEGFDTFEANIKLGLPEDGRNYKIAAKMLHDLGVGKIHLLTNNMNKRDDLVAHGIDVVKVIPTKKYLNFCNQKYLDAKAEKGHLFGKKYA